MNSSFFSDLLIESLNENSGFFFRKGILLEEGRTPYQTYEVWDTPELGRLFRLDGYFMTSERDEFLYHENMIHTALISHPNPRSILVIGGGDGGSADEIFKHPSVERIVLVELDQAVIDLSRTYFEKVHHGSLDDPRIQILIEDGQIYVRETGPRQNETFDLIVLDLTDPLGPAAELYSQKFMLECKNLLNPKGLMVLHIGPPVFAPERVSGLMRNLEAVFTIVAPYFIYIPLYGSLWGMACVSDSSDPRRCTAKMVDEMIQSRKIADLQYYNGSTHEAGFALPEYLKKILYS